MSTSTAPTPPRPAAPKLSRRAIVAIVAAVVLLAVAAIVFILPVARHPAAIATSPSASASMGNPQPSTGGTMLTTLARDTAALPAAPRTGTYEYLRHIIWGPKEKMVYAVDERTWRQPDGIAKYAVDRHQDLAAKGFDPMTANLDFASGAANVRVLDAIQDPDIHDQPDIILADSGDPVAQLNWYLNTARNSQTADTQRQIRDLIDIYHHQLVPPKLRAAILLALAQLPDTTSTHHSDTDPLHRDSIAFTTTFTDSDVTILVDPATGLINAVRERFKGRLWEYTLFFPAEWTAIRGPGPAQPTPASTIHPSTAPAPRT
ncbi:hypothetical protein [Hamadaea tsunoensis]|uniref:hypothetical protein n=1 Tax=Hamadaea tsunoensis TaxID=53368 RepID=UPI0004885A92|nr:hypothetical protein [Hamadaea tsunoensis]